MTPATDPMLPEAFVVEKYKKETADTFTVTLAAENGEDFHFGPGQFNMLYVFGVGEAPISISGDPEKSEKVVHTIRAVGTVTNPMQRLRKGDVIGLRGPFGSSWPVEEAHGKDVVVIAGGIGLAPLRPTIYHLLTHRDQYGKIVLLYGARTPGDLLFQSELRKWSSLLDVEVFVTVDVADKKWHGNVGVVTNLIQRIPFDEESAVAMVCGPEIMMRFCVSGLQTRGVTQDRIYVSMERNMKCAVGFCGHCQYGPHFICKDGPVFPYHQIHELFITHEI